MENKVKQMPQAQQTSAKKLDVEIQIKSVDCDKPFVLVKLSDGVIFLHSESFPLLPNVPLESYVQYTFASYNASLCQNQTENPS